MNLFRKKLSDFFSVDIEQSKPLDNQVFQSLLFLVNRIGKTTINNVQIIETLKDSILQQQAAIKENSERINKERMNLITDNQEYEATIIEYSDLILLTEEYLKSAKHHEALEILDPIIRLNSNVLSKMGITIIPTKNVKPEGKLYIVNGIDETDNSELNGFVSRIVSHGYRRGERLIKKCSVTIYKLKS